jgi:hypothetical protein
MAKAKELWGSDEQDEDILDRFLKVKKFQENQLPSYESELFKKIKIRHTDM